MDGPEPSRPASPASPMTSSFYDATTTIDDLTTAIADLSCIPSPDPTTATFICCCGKDDCHSFKSWVELRTKLNQRLVLSAGTFGQVLSQRVEVLKQPEVGQALLRKHEAYVRQSERQLRDAEKYPENDESNRSESTTETLQQDLDDLMKEKAHLEKRLNQALVNSEVTEVSSKTILQELQEARETISRLTAHHARSVGWETRLSSTLRERDDMQQERDEEMNRARLAESRFAVLKEKTAKLQSEVRRLQESLEEKRLHRLESSEHLIQDARTRLESFRSSQLGLTAKVAEDELTSVLESMVHDNDILKRDNAELQHLVAESREEIHNMQQELEEQRLNPPSRMSRSGCSTPNSRHHHTGSVPAINVSEFMTNFPRRRNQSAERRRRSGQPRITIRMSPGLSESPAPDLFSPPLSATSFTPVESKYGQKSPRASPCAEIDEDVENESSPTLYEKRRGHRPLLLLARSRGVQTEIIASSSVHSPTLPSSTLSPHDPRSESSSLSESPSSPMGIILERLVTLFNSLAQADALTLTNRLKRQHLKGADIGHLSRSTVGNILAEVISLRSHFRYLLEDEKIVTACTRKDLRLFFKLIKDAFNELGQLRVAMNGVILDPSSAVRFSELALNPGLAEGQQTRENGAQSGATAWMAPISKLFLPSVVVKSDSGSSADRISISQSSRPAGSGPNLSRPQKLAPKLGPALGASTTTVNVEFSGTGVGRAVTSTVRSQPTFITPGSMNVTTVDPSSSAAGASSGLMGIFAGAQRPVEPSEPWVVLPPVPRKRFPSSVSNDNNSLSESRHAMSSATIGRSSLRRNTNRLSRNVDAVIDIVEKQPQEGEMHGGEERDGVPPLVWRTLRRRGLSDSSICSTFSSHGTDQQGPETSLPPSPQMNVTSAATGRTPAWRQPNVVFQAFSQWGMFNFRQPMNTLVKVSTGPETPSSRLSKRGVRRDVSTHTTSSSVDEGARLPSASSSADRTMTSEHSSSSHATTSTTAARDIQSKPTRESHPSWDGGVLPQLASWVTSSIMIDPISGSDPTVSSSLLRDETHMHRADTVARRIGREDDTPISEFY